MSFSALWALNGQTFRFHGQTETFSLGENIATSQMQHLRQDVLAVDVDSSGDDFTTLSVSLVDRAITVACEPSLADSIRQDLLAKHALPSEDISVT